MVVGSIHGHLSLGEMIYNKFCWNSLMNMGTDQRTDGQTLLYTSKSSHLPSWHLANGGQARRRVRLSEKDFLWSRRPTRSRFRRKDSK